MNETFLHLRDVAARLGVSREWARRIPPSELPYLVIREHGRRQYREADVAAYIERRTVRG